MGSEWQVYQFAQPWGVESGLITYMLTSIHSGISLFKFYVNPCHVLPLLFTDVVVDTLLRAYKFAKFENKSLPLLNMQQAFDKCIGFLCKQF